MARHGSAEPAALLRPQAGGEVRPALGEAAFLQVEIPGLQRDGVQGDGQIPAVGLDQDLIEAIGQLGKAVPGGEGASR
jgi:hypothetical protein